MGAVDFREVFRSLDGRPDVSNEVKKIMRETLRQIARENGDATLEPQERIEFAVHLLNMQESRKVTRNRLIARYGISKRTAQRDIDAALQMRHKHHSYVAQVPETITNEEVTTGVISGHEELSTNS